MCDGGTVVALPLGVGEVRAFGSLGSGAGPRAMGSGVETQEMEGVGGGVDGDGGCRTGAA